MNIEPAVYDDAIPIRCAVLNARLGQLMDTNSGNEAFKIVEKSGKFPWAFVS
jgi:hypothetical protein